jgi:hypothetical protein
MKSQPVDQFVADMNRLADMLGQESIPLALEDCQKLVYGDIEENFLGAHDPEGAGWPVRKNPKPQHPLLMLTGALAEAATNPQAPGAVSRIEGEALEVGVTTESDIGSLKGARRHNYGDLALGLGDGIRKREFVGISEETEQRCEDVCVEYLMQELV